MPNASGDLSPYRSHVNSAMKKEPHQTPIKQSPLNRSQNVENVALKKEPVTPVSFTWWSISFAQISSFVANCEI